MLFMGKSTVAMAIFNSELLVITRGYPHYPMVRPVGRLVEGQLRLRTEQPLLQRRAGGAPVRCIPGGLSSSHKKLTIHTI